MSVVLMAGRMVEKLVALKAVRMVVWMVVWMIVWMVQQSVVVLVVKME